VERAEAGQRVALNLVGVAVDEVARGDVITSDSLAPTYVADVAVEAPALEHAQRVQIHHGTREAPARVAELGGRFWQLRLEQPLLARPGDRFVIRSIAPPDTLGGGVILDPNARKHGPSREALARLSRIAKDPRAAPPPPPGARHTNIAVPGEQTLRCQAPQHSGARHAGALEPAAVALEERLRAAGHEPPLDAELGDDAVHLEALREAGRVVRLGRSMHAHAEAAAAVRAAVERLVGEDGHVTLARLRDELRTSRKFAQAWLEHLDAARVTLRRPDDSRVLRRRPS
jgi:selenocysteine-specific elongation factor